MVAVPHATILNCDMAAREYIQALGSGIVPEPRPDVGRWEGLIIPIERAFVRSKGDASRVAGLIADLRKQHPELDDLLRPEPEEPTLARVEEVNEQGMPALPASVQLPKDASYGACPELDIYEAFSRKASPQGWDEFHAFCGLWMFSVIAGRRVHLDIKRKSFYTNLMLTMCSDTSFFAKSFTAKVARDVLYELNLNYLLAPNRISPQKLLSDMAGTHVPANYGELKEEKQARVKQRLSMPGQRGLFFDEFGKFVQNVLRKNSTMADFVNIFMEMDECPAEYENATISRGGELIENPYLALLGCMTRANLKEHSQAGADFWTDGFWARFGFVCAPIPTPDMIPDEDETDDDNDDTLPIPYRLISSLKAWHERLGVPRGYVTETKEDKSEKITYSIDRDDLPQHVCTISPEAKAAWKRYAVALKRLSLTLGHGDFRGNYVRLSETAMRIAVLLASLSNNNHIEIKHWARAQELAEVLRKNLHILYAQVNMPVERETKGAKIEDDILRNLKRVGPLSLSVLRNCYMKKHSTKDLKEVLNAMVNSGSVTKFKAVYGEKYKIREEEEETL